jgi:hypothetical protein
MGRIVGAINKSESSLPHYATLPTAERIIFLANLIVDRIISDQNDGKKLEKEAKRRNYGKPIQT